MVNPTVVRQRVPGLGLWQFPDLRESMREYVDAVLATTAPADEGSE